MPTENQILQTLSQIILNNTGRNIVQLGLVKNIKIKDAKISLDIDLPPAMASFKNQVEKQAGGALLALDGVSVAKVNVLTGQNQPTATAPNPLETVKATIAISSCKGGVGKSTLAVYLAQELASRGKRVGLLDADVYGPSLPTLLNLPSVNVYTNEQNQLIPIEKDNIKLMSFGFLLGDAPAVMRGPIVTRYIQQLLFSTAWGELDYLFIDMPPGTGDIHLTITQTIRLNGAVIITTPHTLSLVDVARGILMFEKVNVPILGVIENMSYFVPDDSDKRHYIFGTTSAKTLEERFGVSTLAEVPVLKTLSESSVKYIANSYIQEAADNMLKAIEVTHTAEEAVPTIKFDDKEIHLTWRNGEVWTVENRTLRLNSQDALSVNELTGEKLIKPEDIRPDIAAKEITPLGNYAIGVSWNDGHSAGIYPYKNIKELASVSKN